MITTIVNSHFSRGFCDVSNCTFDGYDGHEFWPTLADYGLQHHADGAVCPRHFSACGQPGCSKATATDTENAPARHAAEPEVPVLSGQLDEDLVTATDGEREVAVMPREVFEAKYAGFGWSLLDTSEPDPQWPTEDPDQPAWDADIATAERDWFTAYLPAKEPA